MERVGDATRPDAQPEPVAQQRGDLAVREAEVFIEQHDQRDRVRPEMRARRSERIRRLQRVASLHAPTTVATPAHVHIEATHVRPHDRQILLNLGGDARLGQPAAAMRALIGEGDVDPFVDRGWRLSVGMSPVTATGATSRPPRLRRRRAFRERGRLTLAGAPRRLRRARQALDVPPQPIRSRSSRSRSCCSWSRSCCNCSRSRSSRALSSRSRSDSRRDCSISRRSRSSSRCASSLEREVVRSGTRQLWQTREKSTSQNFGSASSTR